MKQYCNVSAIVCFAIVALVLMACEDTKRPPIFDLDIDPQHVNDSGWTVVSEYNHDEKYILSFRNKITKVRCQIIVGLNKIPEDNLQSHQAGIIASYNLSGYSSIHNIRGEFLSKKAFMTSEVNEEVQTNIVVCTFMDQGLPVSMVTFSHWDAIPEKGDLETLYQNISASKDMLKYTLPSH